MSHVSKIKAAVKNLDALEIACERIGVELVRGQKKYKWWGRFEGDYPLPEGFSRHDLGKCDHAIRVKGSNDAYEVGVVARRDGQPGFELLFDFWQGGYGLEAAIGKNGQKLVQAYAVEAAKASLKKQGFLRIQEVKKPNGGVRLKYAAR